MRSDCILEPGWNPRGEQSLAPLGIRKHLVDCSKFPTDLRTRSIMKPNLKPAGSQNRIGESWFLNQNIATNSAPFCGQLGIRLRTRAPAIQGPGPLQVFNLEPLPLYSGADSCSQSTRVPFNIVGETVSRRVCSKLHALKHKKL